MRYEADPAPAPRPVRRLAVFSVAALAVIAPLALLAGCAGADSEPTAPESRFPAGWRYDGAGDPVAADHGMVVSTDPLASDIGIEILEAGGNAADAAVAVAFALAVVNPEAGNIGGDGFLVVRMATGEAVALDFRCRAPLAAHRDMYLDAEGNVTEDVLVGHRSVATPGTVAGMGQLHARFGRLPWAALLAPAIALADGFEVHQRFLNPYAERLIGMLRRFPASAAQFLPADGQPPALGEVFRQPELAETLRRIAAEGADEFYRGKTADLIVAEMERGGGLVTHEDLASYTAPWRDPIVFSYRGHTVISMPPTSSGGVTLAQIANILSRHDLGALGFGSPETLHIQVEAWRRAYADRNHRVADPEFFDVPVALLTSMDYADQRAATISPEAATPSSEVGPAEWPPAESEDTTHYSIVDAEGNAVSVTTTVNSFFGSKVTVAGAGFLLNNDMDDLAAKPGTPNQFGLVQGENNAIAPGKRMLSSMSPSIALDPDGELFMVTGTPGGATIITSVFQTLSNVVDHGMGVVAAVEAPRIHHQHLPDQIFHEPGGLAPETVAALEALGHTVVEAGRLQADIQMILVEDGKLTSWSDPRRGGAARGY